MSCRLPVSAPQENANRSAAFLCAALIAVLFCLLVFNGCSSVSVPANATTTSATTSTANLNISAQLPAASVGLTYNAALKVTGGVAPYVFSIPSGQLPPGVLLDATSGAISGTPSATGDYSFAASVSDSNGLSKQQSLEIAVSSPSTTTTTTSGQSFLNLQHSSGWAAYGQGPPDFVDCSPSPCDGISYSMSQGIQNPSMSGKATQYNLGGTAVYTDALFNNHLIGDLSSQGIPDSSHSLVSTYHSFTYDVYFYGTNLELSQAVEFDINQFFDNLGFIWGHECRIAGGHEWDVWDNVTAHWTPTGVACNPIDNSWNHLTIQVQRTSNNQLLYQSITLNGVTSTLNQYYDPGSAPGWYGVTINYQMDGNYQQSPYAVYLDQLTFTYE